MESVESKIKNLKKAKIVQLPSGCTIEGFKLLFENTYRVSLFCTMETVEVDKNGAFFEESMNIFNHMSTIKNVFCVSAPKFYAQKQLTDIKYYKDIAYFKVLLNCTIKTTSNGYEVTIKRKKYSIYFYKSGYINQRIQSCYYIVNNKNQFIAETPYRPVWSMDCLLLTVLRILKIK